MNIPKVGKRNLKTAIAVAICLILLPLIGFKQPFYACIASVLSMQDTPENSWQYGKTRLKATFLGGIVGIVFIFINQLVFDWKLLSIITPLGIIASIYLCNLVNWKSASGTACVVYCSVLINHSNDMYTFALNRMIETALGVLIALLVNKFLFKREKTV